jgi:hypothetical protein
MLFNKVSDAACDKSPELIWGARLELIRHAAFALGDLELASDVGENDLADTKVGATHIKCQEFALLVSGWKPQHPGYIHGLESCLGQLWWRWIQSTTYNITTTIAETCRIPVCQLTIGHYRSLGIEKDRTFLQLPNELFRNLFKLFLRHGEHLLETFEVSSQGPRGTRQRILNPLEAILPGYIYSLSLNASGERAIATRLRQVSPKLYT